MQVLVAMALAIVLGYVNPARAVAMKPLGDAFIRVITMIITLIIFCTLAVAGVGGRAYYLFEGLLQRGNWARLHMDSTTFDEPDFVTLIPETDYVITFHGAERDRTRTIYVGGLHEEGRRLVIEALKDGLDEYGITAMDATRSADAQTIAGLNPRNLTNRGRMGQGAQLEFSKGARLVFFPGESKTQRQRPNANLGVLARSIDGALRGLTGFPQVADVAP